MLRCAETDVQHFLFTPVSRFQSQLCVALVTNTGGHKGKSSNNILLHVVLAVVIVRRDFGLESKTVVLSSRTLVLLFDY